MIDVMCVVEKKKMYDLRQFFLLENWITNRFWREEKIAIYFEFADRLEKATDW